MAGAVVETPAPPAGSTLQSAASWAPALVVTILFGAAAAALLVGSGSGLDLTDEGHYLLAADNHQPTAAFNSLFGHYTGIVFRAVGYDIVAFRIVGVLILALAGLVLGLAVVRLVAPGARRTTRSCVAIGVAAGSLTQYNIFLRTPGYNWLTLIGLMLVVAGAALELLERPSRRDDVGATVLLGLGVFLSFMGKAPAGAAAAAVGIVATLVPLGGPAVGPRLRVGAAAALVAAALFAAHFLFVEGPAATAQTLRDSLDMLGVMDPAHYRIGSALVGTGREALAIPREVVTATGGLVWLGLLPLVAWFAPSARGSLVAAGASAAAVIVVSVDLIVAGLWEGGPQHYHANGVAALSLAMTMLLAAVATVTALTARRWLPGRPRPDPPAIRGPIPPPSSRLLVVGVLAVASAFAYAFGSNNGLVTQTSGATILLLLGTTLVLAAVIGSSLQASVLTAGAVILAIVAGIVVPTARATPYRTAPLDEATVSIAFGQHATPLLVDPAAAAYWNQVATSTAAAGWHPGTRLLDLTWSPSLAYALGATVPTVLLPRVGIVTTANASAIEALALSGDPADWASAWVVVPPDQAAIEPGRILATVGRSFPADYVLVADLTAPGTGLHQQIWRPR